MAGYRTRALIALLLAVFLFVQARAVAGQRHRRQAFALSAAALLALAGYNGALALGLAIGPLQVGLVIAAMALFIGAVASLALSYVTGELRGERDRMATAARAYRERRATDDRRPTTDDRRRMTDDE